MDFIKEMQLRTEEADRIICEYMLRAGSFDGQIIEAMNYSINAGGKRIRPVLIMAFYRMLGGRGAEVHPFMAAMEMLHTYSLVHDDLPAIDNDDYRRGRYTTHKQYGEAVGVLAGDGLLHTAYETAMKAFDYGNTDNVIRALRIFGRKTGVYGMFGGQAADVINTGSSISDELMMYIYENKTGALIEGSMMIGAALAGADDELLAAIERAGSDIGMAFQIRDDILDISGDENVIGKPVHSDERNNKKTYISINGIERSKRDIVAYTGDAVSIINNIGCDNEDKNFITALFEYLVTRSK